MQMDATEPQQGWTEELSHTFIDYGRYFIPEREYQMRLLVDLLADVGSAATIVELCCGEGLLAEALLEAHPESTVLAFDGSPEMLAQAQRRLARFGERFRRQHFDLAAASWRVFEKPVEAVVSSLAIHHLDGAQKQRLYGDIFNMLAPGGALVVADVVEVAGAAAKRRAANEWDDYVRRRAYELDGNLSAFEYFQRTGWNMYRYLDPEDIDKPSPLFDQLRWLEMAGFSELDVNWSFIGHVVFSARKPVD